MIPYSPKLKAVGGARTGIAPVNLLDVQDVNGNLYYWSDRPSNALVVIPGELDPNIIPPVPPVGAEKVTWIYPNTVENWASGCGSSACAHTQMSANGSIGAKVGVGWGESGTGGGTAYMRFSGFTLPPLPADAMITKILAVMNGSYLQDQIQGGFYGHDVISWPSTRVWAGEYSGAVDPPEWGGPFAPALWQANSLSGFTLEQEVVVPHTLGLPAGSPGGSCSFTASFVGLCVYYTSASGGEPGPYIPWLVAVPSFSFHRSLVTDTGSFVIQNLSGDTLSRDFEKIARRSALEGAFFVYRLWQAGAQEAWLEVHGTLSVDDIGQDTVRLKGSQLLNPSQDDTPLENYSETCQLQWGGRRCGSMEATECQYSFQSCQVPERIMVALNSFEKNYGENDANTAMNVINRRRTI